MNDDDTQTFAVFDFGEFTYFAVVNDITGVGTIGINAAENLHQRGFTCAVLTDQCVDGATLYHQVHVIQRFDAGEFLGDIFHFEDNI